METVEVLKQARALIENEKHWIRHHSRRQVAPGVMGFCSYGAIDAVTVGGEERSAAEAVLQLLVPGGEVARFNDDPRTTHPMILDLFDRAIAKAEAAA